MSGQLTICALLYKYQASYQMFSDPEIYPVWKVCTGVTEALSARNLLRCDLQANWKAWYGGEQFIVPFGLSNTDSLFANVVQEGNLQARG